MSYRDEYKAAQREAYWYLPRVLLGVLVLMLVLYGIGFLATGGDLAIYRFWAPKQENARRVVFQNTQSFVQGKITHLTDLQLAYAQATGEQKDPLRTVRLREAAQVDEDKLPPDLVGFIHRLKGGIQ